MTKDVSILLSTYNGGLFLRQQIESLLNQDFYNYKIYIRDDGSFDSTNIIIEEFTQQYPEKIIQINDDHGNKGVRSSFVELMKVANSDYYFFCDQDDIWQPNKISEMLSQFSNMFPELVFCDSEIIDENSNIIYSSFFNQFPISTIHINRGLFIGYVPGCFMAFNQKAKDEFLKCDFNTGLHDSNLFIIVGLTGKIYYLNERLMSYRIHYNNTIGFGHSDKLVILAKDFVKYIFRNKEYRRLKLDNYFKQVKSISSVYDEDLLLSKEIFNEDYINNLSNVKRKKWYMKHFMPFHKGIIEGFVRICCI